MDHWTTGLLLCLGVAGILWLSAGARAEAPAGSPTVVLSVRRLAAAKGKLPPAVGGTMHVWAWQRSGAAVRWTVAGRKLPARRASGEAKAFAWVKLGVVDIPAGKQAGVRYDPRSSEAAKAAVGALMLTTDPKADPSVLWRLSRVYPRSLAASPDRRPLQCRHLNQRFTMGDYPTKGAWQKRAAWLREHVRVASGLLPEPARCELKPRVFGRIERDGYTIEKAFIESYPGFYVCGNLYRPRGRRGPFPGVASPHGHWGQGRFGHEPPRGSVPARCITLARLGYVVFAYDMIGYNDSGKQLGKHRGVIPSTVNELWGLSPMHLQSWNTIRAIDFLQSLDDVDAKRIGLTGCSGGGTQTFMVMGIDDRVTAAAPVCMISGIMQGGCECENAPLLRIETNNIEIGALMAPRPLIMPSATGDWTKETPTVEYPSIRRIYELFGLADRVASVHTDSAHGYNKQHREGVYSFFERRLKGTKGARKITEPAYKPEKKADLLVWQGRTLPADAKTPKTLMEHIRAECRRRRDELLPKRPADRKRFGQTLGAAYRHAILAKLPGGGELDVETLATDTVGEVRVTRLLLGRKGVGDRVPALLYRAKGASGRAPACLVVCQQGKADLIDAAKGGPGKLLSGLLAGRQSVLAIDAYLTGEYHSPLAQTKQKADKGFFSTYNRTAVVQRVQDILMGLAYLRGRKDVSTASLIGLGQAGAWCLLAAPLSPSETAVAADLAQIAGDADPRWLGDLFTPCILKAGGLWTAAALAAPRRVMLHHLADEFDTAPLRAAYRAAGTEGAGKLRIDKRPLGPDAICRWVTQQ